MKKRLKTITYNLENSFYIHVIKHGLAMMIPILLTGGIANALLNLPIQAYQRIIENSFLRFFCKLSMLVHLAFFRLPCLLHLAVAIAWRKI